MDLAGVGGQVIGRRRGPSIGVGSPVCLHRGSKAGPGWTLGEADKALEEYGHCPKPPPTALDHFMEHPITIPPPPMHTSYRTFHGFRLWMFCAQTITYINISLIIWSTMYTLHGSRFVIKQTTIIKVQPNPTWSDLVILILPFIHDPGDQWPFLVHFKMNQMSGFQKNQTSPNLWILNTDRESNISQESLT